MHKDTSPGLAVRRHVPPDDSYALRKCSKKIQVMRNWFLYQQDYIPSALHSITLVCLNLSGSVNPQDDYVARPVHSLAFNKQHKALGNWICVCPQAKGYWRARAGPAELLPMTQKDGVDPVQAMK
jgi:hypothetical protein